MTSDNNQPYILVVDNNNLLRKELVNYCEQQGCKVQDYNDVHLAIKSCENENYDLVVTDYDFEDLKGRNFLEVFKSNGKELPIICLSSSYETADAISAIKSGAYTFLKKPVGSQELINAVKSAINKNCNLEKINNYIDECNCVYKFKTENADKIDIVEIVLENILKQLNFGTKEKLKIKLAFQEALTNAIEHGNLELKSIWKDEFNSKGIDVFSIKKKERLSDPYYCSKEITIKIGYNNSFLFIEVKDEGPGYQIATSKNISKNEIKMHGRGLDLICSCMDEIKILDCGKRLVMKKLR